MQKLGYGPDNRLKIKVTTRDLPYFRDPAVILIDQLKEVYIDGELETIDTAALVSQGQRARTTPSASTCRTSGPTTPTRCSTTDLRLRRRVCNYNGYCNPESRQADRAAIDRGRPGTAQAAACGQIERRLAEDGARPIIFYDRGANLLAALGQGADDHGQQHLQRLAHGRRLARQINAPARDVAQRMKQEATK